MNTRVISKKESSVPIFTNKVAQIKLPVKTGVSGYEWNSDWKEGDNLLSIPIRHNFEINPDYLNHRLVVETIDDKYILVVKRTNSHGTDYVTVDNKCIDPIRIKKTINLMEFQKQSALKRYDIQ